MAPIRHIHLIAVCGTGMGALAGLLKASGYHVTGSDLNVYPPMSTWLAALDSTTTITDLADRLVG